MSEREANNEPRTATSEQRVAGIIGGIAPESTIAYYRQILAAWREGHPDGGNPPLIIKSIDLKRMLALVAADRFDELTDWLLRELQRLAGAGAGFALFASNTPHIVFPNVRRRSPLPLLSIVEATCDHARSLGLRRLGIFGTRFTMQGRFYRDVFSHAGIELVAPPDDEQQWIHDKYLGELVNAVFLDSTRDGLLAIAQRLASRDAIDGLILGGTELPLILNEDSGPVPFLDTTKIHVARVVRELEG
jgi:aspartate racemase